MRKSLGTAAAPILDGEDVTIAFEHDVNPDPTPGKRSAGRGSSSAGSKKRTSTGSRSGGDGQKKRKVDSGAANSLMSSVNAALDSTPAVLDNEIQTIEVIPCTLDEAIVEALGRSVKFEKHWSDRSIAGTPCKVYWSTDNVWYGGRILFMSRDEKSIFVHYDDGMTEWVDIKTESVLLGLGLVAHGSWPAQRYWLSELAQQNFPKMSKGIYIEYIGEKLEHAYVKEADITSFFSVKPGLRIKNINMAMEEIERKRFIVRTVAEKVRSLMLKRLSGEDLVGARIRVNRDELVRAIHFAARRASKSHREDEDLYGTSARAKVRRRKEAEDATAFDLLPEFLTGTILAANTAISKYYVSWDHCSTKDPHADGDDNKVQRDLTSEPQLPRWLGLHETVRNAEAAPAVEGIVDVPAQIVVAFDMPEITPSTIGHAAGKTSSSATPKPEAEELLAADIFRCCGLCQGARSDKRSEAAENSDDIASVSEVDSAGDQDSTTGDTAFVSCTKCRQSYHTLCMPPLVSPYPAATVNKDGKKTSKDKRFGDDWLCWFCTECGECKANSWEKQVHNVDLKELILSYDRTFRFYAGAKRECRTNRFLCVGCVDKYSLLKKEYCPICLETYPSDQELKHRDIAEQNPVQPAPKAPNPFVELFARLNNSTEFSNVNDLDVPGGFAVPKYLSEALPVMRRLKSYSDNHSVTVAVEESSRRKLAAVATSNQQRSGAGNNLQSPVKKRLHSTNLKSKFGELMQQSSEECRTSPERALNRDLDIGLEDKNQSEDTCEGMVECNDCGRWVHAKCEAINQAAFEAIGNCTHPVWGDEYLCPKCRYNAFTATLNKLEDRDVYNLFAAPVNEELAPGYSELIRYPMDLATMRTKIETGVYKSMQTLRQDFELICANAVKFNKRGDQVWKASVVFFLRGSDVLSKTRVSQLSLYGQEVLKIVTAEEIQQTILKSLTKTQSGDKDKKEADQNQKPVESRSKQPKTKLAALSNERYQPPKWLANWLESELQPKNVKEAVVPRTRTPATAQLLENVYARVTTSYRSSSSRRRGNEGGDSQPAVASVTNLFTADPAGSTAAAAVAATDVSSTALVRSESAPADPLISELSKFPKLVPFAAVTEFVRSTINSVSHEIAHFDCARDLCLVCGTAGTSEASELIFCCDCGEGYHSYCVFPPNTDTGRIERAINREWRCMNCSRCDECVCDSSQGTEARTDEYIYCDNCDKAFHLSCITPKLSVIPEFSWYCKHCVQCSSCAAGVGPDYFGRPIDGTATSEVRRGRIWGKMRDMCVACTIGNRLHPKMDGSAICKIIEVIDTPKACFSCNKVASSKFQGSNVSSASSNSPDFGCSLYCTFCLKVQHLECYQKFLSKLRLEYASKYSLDMQQDFMKAMRKYCTELQQNFVCTLCRGLVQKRVAPDSEASKAAVKHTTLNIRQARLFYSILKRMSEGHFRAARFRLKLFESILFCRTVTMWALSIVREAPQILPFVFKAFVGPSALYARSKVSRVPMWSLLRATRFVDVIRGEYGTRATPVYELKQLQQLSKILHSDWLNFDATQINEMQWTLEDLSLLFKLCGLAGSFMWVMFRLLRFDASPILKAAYVRWAAPSGPAYKILSHGLSMKGSALAPSVNNTALSDEYAALSVELEPQIRLNVNPFEKMPIRSVGDVEAEAKIFRFTNEVCVSNIISLLRRFLEPPSPHGSSLSSGAEPSAAETDSSSSSGNPAEDAGEVADGKQSAAPGSDPNQAVQIETNSEDTPNEASSSIAEPTKPLNDFNSCLSDELVSIFFKDKAVRVKLEQFIVSILMPPAGIGKTITENGIKTRREIVAELREDSGEQIPEKLLMLSMVDDVVDIDNFYFNNINCARDASSSSLDRYFDVSTTSWDIYTLMMASLRGSMAGCCNWWFQSNYINNSSDISDPMLAEIRSFHMLKSSQEIPDKKYPSKKKKDNKTPKENTGKGSESMNANENHEVEVNVVNVTLETAIVPQVDDIEIAAAVIPDAPSTANANEPSTEAAKRRPTSKLRDVIEPVSSLVSPDRCHVIVNGKSDKVTALTGWEVHPNQGEVWEDFRRCAFCSGPDCMPSVKLYKLYKRQFGDSLDRIRSVVKIESEGAVQDGNINDENLMSFEDIDASTLFDESQVQVKELAPVEGRLVPLPHFTADMRYAHVNCLRYSAGVTETDVGELRGTAKALAFADATVCSFCHQTGASLKCDIVRCKKVFHLRCGIVSGCFSITGRWKHVSDQSESTTASIENDPINPSVEVVHAHTPKREGENKPKIVKKSSNSGGQTKSKKVTLNLPSVETPQPDVASPAAPSLESSELHTTVPNRSDANESKEDIMNVDAEAQVEAIETLKSSEPEEALASEETIMHDEANHEHNTGTTDPVEDAHNEEPQQSTPQLEGPGDTSYFEPSGRSKREVKPKVVRDASDEPPVPNRARVQSKKKKATKVPPKLGVKAAPAPNRANTSGKGPKAAPVASNAASSKADNDSKVFADENIENNAGQELNRSSRHVNQSMEILRKCKEHAGELRILINCNDHISNFERDWLPFIVPPAEPCREITIEPKDWLPAILADGSSSIGEKRKFAIARLLKDGRAAARIGSITIHDIGQPVVDSIWFNDSGVIYPPGFSATRLHWSYVRPGERTLYQFEILSSRNFEHLLASEDAPIDIDASHAHFPVFRLTALDDPSFVHLSLCIEDSYLWLRRKVGETKEAFSNHLQSGSVEPIRLCSSKIESNYRLMAKFAARSKANSGASPYDTAVKLAALRFFGLGLEVVHRSIEMSSESVAAMMPNLFMWGTGHLDESSLASMQKKLELFTQRIVSPDMNVPECMRIIAARRGAAYEPSFVLPQKNATAELLRLISSGRKTVVPKVTCSKAMSFIGGKLKSLEEFEVDGASILNKVADVLQSSKSASAGSASSSSFSRSMKRATKTDVEEEEPAGLAELLAEMPDDGTTPASERLQARLEKDYWSMHRNNTTNMSSFLAANKSAIHGWGLYAQRDFPANSMLIEYIGEEIRHTVADRREAEYERQMGLTGSCYLFRLDKDSVIDATHTGGMARFLNHCCEPNSYAYIISTRTRPAFNIDDDGTAIVCQPIGAPVKEQKHIVIMASRHIKAGEEITYDYKFPIEEDNKLPCLCGAVFCRGSMN